MSAITTCGAMPSSCSTAFGAELNGKTWCPFSRQRVTITSTIAGSSSIITILAMVNLSAENISVLRKRKRFLEFCRLGQNPAANHRPTHGALEVDDLLEHRCRSCPPFEG